MAKLQYRRILGIGEIQTRGSKVTIFHFPLVINNNIVQTIRHRRFFASVQL